MIESSAHEEPLFYVDPVKVKAPTRKDQARAARPVWSKYRPKNAVKCDDCMLLLAQQHGKAPASQPARWKRKQGASDLLLCYAHAALRRDADGLGAL